MNVLDAAYSVTIGPHYCWHRYVSGKYGAKAREKTGRVPDRFRSAATAVLGRGDPHYEPPGLWLHAVSVGEVLASVDLAAMFAAANPRWEMRFSTTTATGRSVAEKHWGEEPVFYYPLDFSWMVRRAFDNIRPSLIVLMELEIWPNFLAEAARREVPVVVANARITERSVRRLSWVPQIAENMAQAVEAWFAQTEEYAERLVRIGVPPNRIEVTGSVKYDSVPLELDDARAAYYRRLFSCSEHFHCNGGDLLVVAGSTHPGEEKLLLDCLRTVHTEQRPFPRVVLAPRHPERLDEVEAVARQYGRVARRSGLLEPSDPGKTEETKADVILVDTMGELAKMYAAADIVFVGGTLVRHGGQNFMEPCGLARPTVVGPHLWNFNEPAKLLGGECMRIVHSPEELTAALESMIDDPESAEELGRRARAALVKQRGATRRMAERLNSLARAAAAGK